MTKHASASPHFSAMAWWRTWASTSRSAAQVAEILAEACDRAAVKAHRGGTYVCMEGPQFSTLAEAHVHRQLRFDVVGMTNVTEAKLAREAEICYATVAMITDYDCWHPEHSSVTVDRNHRQSESQRGECAKRASRSRSRDAPRPHLRMRRIAEARDSHRSRNDSSGYAPAPGADCRPVSGVDEQIEETLCHYSWLVRSLLTQSKRPWDAWIARWAARPLISRWPQAFSRG